MLAARREQNRSCSNTEREREIISIGGQVQPTHLTQPIGAAWIFRGEPRREAQPKRGAVSQLYNFLDHGGKWTIPKMQSRSSYSGLKETKKQKSHVHLFLQFSTMKLLSISTRNNKIISKTPVFLPPKELNVYRVVHLGQELSLTYKHHFLRGSTQKFQTTNFEILNFSIHKYTDKRIMYTYLKY